jgi:pimeloyl-ACP methyl ester carboxylesterase
MLPRLQESTTPKLQSVDYGERFAGEVPATTLVRIPPAGHIPMEKHPGVVAPALGDFLTGY